MAGENRQRKAERIQALQGKHEIAEWRLASIQRARNAVVEQQRDILNTLNGETLAPLLVDQVSRRLKILGAEQEKLDMAATAQAERVRQAGLSLKRAERHLNTVSAETAREEEGRALQDILEAMAGREASFPPD
jgi:hypothetical protein